jgi:hypothetical protein
MVETRILVSIYRRAILIKSNIVVPLLYMMGFALLWVNIGIFAANTPATKRTVLVQLGRRSVLDQVIFPSETLARSAGGSI